MEEYIASKFRYTNLKFKIKKLKKVGFFNAENCNCKPHRTFISSCLFTFVSSLPIRNKNSLCTQVAFPFANTYRWRYFPAIFSNEMTACF